MITENMQYVVETAEAMTTGGDETWLPAEDVLQAWIDNGEWTPPEWWDDWYQSKLIDAIEHNLL